MKSKIIFTLLILFTMQYVHCALPPGRPDRSSDFDALPGFKSPPKGYGEVPFYWWLGDTLTRDRIRWHLDELSKKKVSSIQINYAHSDDGKWLKWGLTYPSKPALFTDEWWELFGWFMREAKKRDMSVSLSDYTLGVASGYALDAAKRDYPELEATKLAFKEYTVTDKIRFVFKTPPLVLDAYKKGGNGEIILSSKRDLKSLLKENKLTWNVPDDRSWIIYSVYTEICPNSYDPMFPHSGSAYIKHFFQKFEDKFPEDAKGGLNFFFSDELEFNIKGNMWNKYFIQEFIKRKGYDIVPHLAALFKDMGTITDKIRLDYNDVAVSLSEENYFKPIYDWHEKRGLIYGCDHGGRGGNVADFGDYFRTQRWNQGPGCDQPFLGKSLIKNKVNASIAHMYERPRVWLEGFYSSGWGTSSAALTDAIYANFAHGQNLLSLHGLYYATPGARWEWAPPCNHFRMPYWQVMESMLECTERLSFILSQGHHVADVAILYPVEPVVAGKGKNAPQTAFSMGKALYSKTIDFDFMDYESLHRATIENGELCISGERFKVIVVPAMQTMKHASLEKLIEFKQKGGTIIQIGDLPVSTDSLGADKKFLEPYLKKYLSLENTGKTKCFSSVDSAVNFINTLFTPDFEILEKKDDKEPYFIHRKIGNRDVYGVYNVSEGTPCFFRATGDIEYWDCLTGDNYKIPQSQSVNKGTVVELPKSAGDFQLIIFTPQSNAPLLPSRFKANETLTLDSVWNCEIKPVLDNKYGDFNWPPSADLVYPEIRNMKSDTNNDITYSYGPYFWQLGPLKEPLNNDQIKNSAVNPEENGWKKYMYSLKYGVQGDEGHQGYHGLKLEMYPEVIRLGKLQRSMTNTTRVPEDGGNFYYLTTWVEVPQSGEYTILVGKETPTSFFIDGEPQNVTSTLYLKKGVRQVILGYDKPCTTYFFIRNSRIPYSNENFLSTPWYNDSSLLTFNIKGNKKPEYEHFSFISAPGLESLQIKAAGDIEVRINGEKTKIIKHKKSTPYNEYTVFAKSKIDLPGKIDIYAKPVKGYYEGAFFDAPIKQQCAQGKITLGDFNRYEGLASYSGGIVYQQNVTLSLNQIKKRARLNLGDLSSAVTLYVNGVKIGDRLSPEWIFDITGKLKEGENELKIILYNTAANHYLTIPTRYRGNTASGLYGPVKIEFE